MLPRNILSKIFRLLIAFLVGISLGLLIWYELISHDGFRSPLEVPRWIVLVFPVLAAGWLVSCLLFGFWAARSTTRSWGLKGLGIALITWVATTIVTLGVYYSFETAYTPSILEVVGSAAYLAAGLNFGIVMLPLLLISVGSPRLARLVQQHLRKRQFP